MPESERRFDPPRNMSSIGRRLNRRVAWNHALLYAAELANRAGLPLLVYEELTSSYPYASDRLHTFILEGVPDTEQRLRKLGIGYMFYLRRKAQRSR